MERAATGQPEQTTLMALGELYSRLGRQRDAVKTLERIPEAERKTVNYWFNLGVVPSKLNDRAGAEQAYRRALEIDSSDLDVLNNLGVLLFQKGEYVEAATTFEKLSGLNPGSRSARLNCASSLARSDELSRAVEVWKVHVRAEPNDHGTRPDLANALWQLGDRDSAKVHYQTIAASDKKNAGALNGLGLWNLEQSNLTEAERLFRGAMAADARFLPAYNNLAVALERLNRRQEAIVVLRKALQIDPNYADAKKNLERMNAAK